jgi:hypothetical protein
MKETLKNTTNRRVYHILILKQLYPPYYDEGTIFYPKYRRGYKNPHKQLMSYEVRMYRTWKYNRKTQWKSK